MGNRSGEARKQKSAWRLRLAFAGLLLLSGMLITDDWLIRAGAELSAAGTQDRQAMIAAGSKLFNPTCSNGYCHGKDGSGGGAPALRDRRFSADYLTRVISEGIPGTAMRAFKEDYSPEQIEQLVAYVMSLSKGGAEAASPASEWKAKPDTPPPTKSEPVKSGAASADPLVLRGDTAAGAKLFFDSTQEKSCGACHVFQGRGGKLGPDLSKIGSRTARELLAGIILPHTAIDPAYAMLAVTTRGGERVVGLKRDEDDEMIRLFDLAALPPVSRTFQKSEIAKLEQLSASAMPSDYAARYTLKQLLDVIAFLKSGGPASQAAVSLKDLF